MKKYIHYFITLFVINFFSGCAWINGPMIETAKKCDATALELELKKKKVNLNERMGFELMTPVRYVIEAHESQNKCIESIKILEKNGARTSSWDLAVAISEGKLSIAKYFHDKGIRLQQTTKVPLYGGHDIFRYTCNNRSGIQNGYRTCNTYQDYLAYIGKAKYRIKDVNPITSFLNSVGEVVSDVVDVSSNIANSKAVHNTLQHNRIDSKHTSNKNIYNSTKTNMSVSKQYPEGIDCYAESLAYPSQKTRKVVFSFEIENKELNNTPESRYIVKFKSSQCSGTWFKSAKDALNHSIGKVNKNAGYKVVRIRVH